VAEAITQKHLQERAKPAVVAQVMLLKLLGFTAAFAHGVLMCRNIKILFNFDPPATEEEIQAAALQFVRKLGGFSKPSKVNEQAFQAAVEAIADNARVYLSSMTTLAPPRNREDEAQKARARSAKRFGRAEA
jgi:hypothetical protein